MMLFINQSLLIILMEIKNLKLKKILNNFLKKIKKNKKYFLSKKDIIFY